jgi:hypothetical protein
MGLLDKFGKNNEEQEREPPRDAQLIDRVKAAQASSPKRVGILNNYNREQINKPSTPNVRGSYSSGNEKIAHVGQGSARGMHVFQKKVKDSRPTGQLGKYKPSHQGYNEGKYPHQIAKWPTSQTEEPSGVQRVKNLFACPPGSPCATANALQREYAKYGVDNRADLAQAKLAEAKAKRDFMAAEAEAAKYSRAGRAKTFAVDAFVNNPRTALQALTAKQAKTMRIGENGASTRKLRRMPPGSTLAEVNGAYQRGRPMPGYVPQQPYQDPIDRVGAEFEASMGMGRTAPSQPQYVQRSPAGRKPKYITVQQQAQKKKSSYLAHFDRQIGDELFRI